MARCNPLNQKSEPSAEMFHVTVNSFLIAIMRSNDSVALPVCAEFRASITKTVFAVMRAAKDLFNLSFAADC